MKIEVSDLMTIKEVAARFDIGPLTVNRACLKGRLKLNEECFYIGRMWLVLRPAAERLWGWRLIHCEPGQRVCKKCLTAKPVTEYPTREIRGRVIQLHTCRDCANLYKLAWYHRNFHQNRQYKAAYARRWRAKHPGHDSRKRAAFVRIVGAA